LQGDFAFVKDLPLSNIAAGSGNTVCAFLYGLCFYFLRMYVRITYAYIMFVYLATAASPNNPLGPFKNCSDF